MELKTFIIIRIAFLYFTTVTVDGATCSKSLMDECVGSLPQPFARMSYAQLLTVAHTATEEEKISQKLFGIPPGNMIERTCSIYHGLRTCDQLINRVCGFEALLRYRDFRESYDNMCGTIGRIGYQSHHQCLTNATNLDTEVISCMKTFVENAHVNANISRKDHMVKYCRARQALKICTLNSVSHICGPYAREYWFKITFPRDQNLEAELYCQDEMRRLTTVNESAWMICADGSNVVPYSYKCDREKDCYSGEDEIHCAYHNEPKKLSTSAIVGIIVGIIVLAVIIVCCCKIRSEIKYKKRYKAARTTEANSIEIKENV